MQPLSLAFSAAGTTAPFSSFLPGSLLALIAITLLGTILLGILPNLAAEPESSIARRSWLIIWLPLLASLPLVITMTFAGPVLREAGAAWHAVSPSASIAGALIASVLAVSAVKKKNRLAIPALDGVILVILGWLLLWAAAADRLTITHGQVLVTIAAVWLWLGAPARPETSIPQSPPTSVTPQKQAARTKRAILVDWSHPLAHPVAWPVKSILFLLLVTSIIVLRWRPPDTLWPVTAVGVILQAIILIGVGVTCGASALARCAVSTVILSTLLSLGGMTLGLVPMESILWWREPAALPGVGPTELLSLSTALKPAAITLMAIGIACAFFDQPTAKDNRDNNSSGAVTSAHGAVPRLPFAASAIVILLMSTVVALSGSDRFLDYARDQHELFVEKLDRALQRDPRPTPPSSPPTNAPGFPEESIPTDGSDH